MQELSVTDKLRIIMSAIRQLRADLHDYRVPPHVSLAEAKLVYEAIERGTPFAVACLAAAQNMYSL